MEQDVILVADHISFHYFDDNERPVPVLRDLSLTVNRGEFVAVLGHNGSGKSSPGQTLQCLCCPRQGTASWTASTPGRKAAFTTSANGWGWFFRTRITRLVATIVEEDASLCPWKIWVMAPAEIRKRVA